MTSADGPESSTERTKPTEQARRPDSRAGRRLGAVVAIAINAALLYIVANLADWDLVGFLTDEFADVEPAIRLVLVTTIVANLLIIAYPARWFADVVQIPQTAFGLYAAVRMLQVFPFSFDRYDEQWTLVVRVLLVVAIGGSLLALIVAPLKLLSRVGVADSDR